MPEVPYRKRQPFVGQRSIVLVFESGEGCAALRRAAQVRFSPAAQWRLACCRAALGWGAPDRLGFEEELLALLPAASDGAAPHACGCIAKVDRAVERARELLASDPSSSDSLHEIAHAVAASPFHLARRFKRANAIGLHGYRTRLRMALALARLGDGEDDLTAVSAIGGWIWLGDALTAAEVVAVAAAVAGVALSSGAFGAAEPRRP